MTQARDAKAWERPRREHRESVEAFLRAVARVPPARWYEPLSADRWTPAEVADHVVLTYGALLSELRGGEPIRVRSGPVVQHLLRWILLPHILFHRSIPVRARAPREVRPAPGGLAQDGVEDALRAVAEDLEREIQLSSRAYLTHPYFGRLGLRRALRFCAAHTDHHRRQLERAATRPA